MAGKKIEIKRRIAENLKSIRISLKLSREELAKRAKLSPRYVYTLESGKRNVSVETLGQLADALDCSVCDILCTPTQPRETKKRSLEIAILALQRELKNL